MQSLKLNVTGKYILSCSLLFVSLVWGFAVQAVEPKTGDGGVAIKKAQGMIRQLSQEKSALEAEKIIWLREKPELESKLKHAEEEVKKLQPLQGEVERYKSSLEDLKFSSDAQLEKEHKKQQALLQKYNELVMKANAIFADNQLLVHAVQERERWIEQCSTRNKDLRALNQDILHKYHDKNWLQQLSELEPLTGIGQVETDSIVEDYQYQLKQLKITPFKAADEKPGLLNSSAPAAVDAPSSETAVPVESAVPVDSAAPPTDDAAKDPAEAKP